MQAVILAAGVGRRLGRFAGGKPKCLVNIGGRPLIKHQLEALADNGVGPVLIVLGCQAEAVREVVGDRAEYIVNDRYEQTNSLYSLWLARDWIKGPFVLLNSDLFFHPEILRRVLEEEGNIIAYDSTASCGREQSKVAIRERRVIDLGKDLPAGSARGESLGVIRFDAEGKQVLLAQADALIKAGYEKAWVTEAVRACCSLIRIYGVNVAGFPWIEVDFPYDLEEARQEVWPAIWRSRWKSFVFWKRTRWAVVGLIAVVLALGGWIASSEVGPASIAWETVAPRGAEKVVLAVGNGSQKWWMVEQGKSAIAELEGGKMVRVESRALQSPHAQIPVKCVLEISLDGQPYDWEVVTANPDPTASLPDLVVGERDRLQFRLPPGQHVLKVARVAGTCEQFLVRIRPQE